MISTTTLIIISFFILNFFITQKLFKDLSLYLNISHTWWFFWMFVSSLSLTGLFIPSIETYLLFILMPTSQTFGLLIYTFYYKFNFRDKHVNKINQTKFNMIEKYLILLSLIFILPLSIILLYKFLLFYFSDFDMVRYRSGIFGLNNEYPLFITALNQSLYFQIFNPILLTLLFIGTSFVIISKKYKLYIFSCILIFMESTYIRGRFGFHYILFTMILILCNFVFLKKKKISNLFNVRISTILFIFISLVIILSLKGENLKNLVFKTTLIYHTEAFSIFDVNLKDSSSLLHEYTFGLSTIAGLERLFYTLISFFGIYKVPQADLIGAYLNTYFFIGINENGDSMMYNAFGSILFNYYRDGGKYGIIMFNILYGILISKYSIGTLKKDLFALAFLISLLFISVYGLFQPILIGSILTTIFYLVFLKFSIAVILKVKNFNTNSKLISDNFNPLNK